MMEITQLVLYSAAQLAMSGALLYLALAHRRLARRVSELQQIVDDMDPAAAEVRNSLSRFKKRYGAGGVLEIERLSPGQDKGY